MTTWYLLPSGPGSPPMNMAVDDVLLEHVANLQRPVLRFYSWTEPAATFGYSQHYQDVASWTPLRPLIRRPTGGGLVPHDADWTYSLVFPPAHSWYKLKALESYLSVHQWIRAAFAAAGVSTELAAAERSDGPGQCFLGAEKFDLLWKGVKMAGAAQRRNRRGLLIQGSIQPRQSGVRRVDWEQAMLRVPPREEPVLWTPFQPDASFIGRVEQLTQERYSEPAHNLRR